jgi:tRNA G46 methylase TrmB
VPVDIEVPGQPLRKRALIVGDGNLSFSRAFAFLHPDWDTIASTYDSKDLLRIKYPGVSKTIGRLTDLGVLVLHQVDATQMTNQLAIEAKFDCIYFNFPHPGNRSASGLKDLVRGFLEQARQMLSPEGVIKLSVMNTEWYRDRLHLWDSLEELALNKYSSSNTELEQYKRHGYVHVKTKSNKHAGQGQDEITYTLSNRCGKPLIVQFL